MSTIKRYAAMLKPHRAKIIGYMISILIACACNLVQPYLLDKVVSAIERISTDGTAQSREIYISCAIMVAAATGGCASMLLAVRLSSHLAAQFTADLRTAIFNHAGNMTLADIRRIGVTAMLDRSTYDTLNLMDFLSMALRAVVLVPVYFIVGCVMAFNIDGVLASLMVVFIPLVFGMIVIVMRLVKPLIKRSNKFLDKQNAIVHERLSGIRIIRAFNREGYEHERMAQATNIMADNFVKTNVTISLTSPIASLLMNIVTVMVLYVGKARLNSGVIITTGDIVEIIQYITLIMNAIFTASFAIMFFPRIKQSVARMNEIFDCNEIDRVESNVKLDGSIKAINCSYHYPDSVVDALLPLSFEIKAGQKVALIGGTGSGKTTIMQLFTGIDKPTGGELYIGGKSSSALTIDEISKNVSTVFQKSDFFTATLRENIDPLNRYTEAEILCALDLAEFGDFARKAGLDYPISQGGSNLSGGQKQRLAIARAFLKDASIYLFDDSFSALDYLTEKRVRSNMAEKLKGKTQIIATQRVSTAYNCDLIMLFDGGKLIAKGKHDELMNNEIYKEIYMSQTGGEYGKA